MLDSSKNCCRGHEPDTGACCIDTYRIYDSRRTQECLENLKILVTDEGQAIIDRASAIRVKSLHVLWTRIQTEEMPFNKGYFQLSIRYYFQAILDCCTGLGTGQDVAGLCAFDKSMILYGGDGSVSIFQSDILTSGFCSERIPSLRESTNHPRAVVEVAQPVALRLTVENASSSLNFGNCCCRYSEIPDSILPFFSGNFTESCGENKVCFLSLGLFSIIRMERPAQLVVPACDALVPEKNEEYQLTYQDPCSLFLAMDFPMNQFYPEANAPGQNHSCNG